MLEYIIVGIIVVAALGIAVYRVVFRPSCGCGCKMHVRKKSCEERRDPLAD
ncbi:MAG: hypothetical protein LBE80_01480 [Deltaproteobacteria bacterium]|jgi:hypothetical protein|nr:hypothetical protein [Deltaproteobacteria bacterium]